MIVVVLAIYTRSKAKTSESLVRRIELNEVDEDDPNYMTREQFESDEAIHVAVRKVVNYLLDIPSAWPIR